MPAHRRTGLTSRIGRRLHYIASMLEGLHQVAKSAEMPFLAYLIDVAREEAKSQVVKRD
ncbi:MAG: hypothetical protein R6X03_00065 [Methyloceanibacter sp.]